MMLTKVNRHTERCNSSVERLMKSGSLDPENAAEETVINSAAIASFMCR
jgi:hypothetical protein